MSILYFCNAKIREKTFNLKRHLERNHPEVYKGVDDQDRQYNSAGSKNQDEKNGRDSREAMAKFFSNEKFTISMTKDKFKQHILKIVVENGIPLTCFSLKGFLGLNGELAGKLGLSLGRHEIRKRAITAAIDRKKLKKGRNDKFVFLKLDGCTRHRVNYLAINVQLINSKNMLDIKTLAVRDTQAQHNSEFLRHTL